VGPMHVMPKQMVQAAGLSGHSQARIESDLSANLDAGAALLANAHTGANDLASWQPAVVATQGPVVATQIYDALRSGESRTTSSGEQIVLAAQALPSSSLAPNAPIGGASVVADTPDSTGAEWNPAKVNHYSSPNAPHA